MFVETIEAVSTGVSVIEFSQKLFPTFKSIFRRLKNGDQNKLMAPMKNLLLLKDII